MSIFGSLLIFGNPLSDFILKGITIANTRTIRAMNSLEFFGRVEVNDMYIENTDTIEVFIINIITTQTIALNNITINH